MRQPKLKAAFFIIVLVALAGCETPVKKADQPAPQLPAASRNGVIDMRGEKLEGMARQAEVSPSDKNPAGALPRPSTQDNAADPAPVPSCLNSVAPLGALNKFSAPELESVRQELLGKGFASAMQNAVQQTSSPQLAIKAALRDALAYDKKATDSFAAAGMTARLDVSDVEAIRQLNGDSLRVATCSGQRNTLLCAAIANKMTAIQYRRLGEELACHYENGTWPGK